MKFKVENLGPIDQLTLDIKPLTIICGENCVGKTYLSYFTFCFLRHLLEMNLRILESQDIKKFLESGEVQIDKADFCSSLQKKINDIEKTFVQKLPSDFSAKNDFFHDLVFELHDLSPIILSSLKKETTTNLVFNNEKMSITIKDIDNNKIMIKMKNADTELNIPSLIIAKYIDASVMSHLDYARVVDPITSERTGISLFYKDLDLNRNELFEILQKKEKIDINSVLDTLSKSSKYPLPIKININEIRNATEFNKNNSIFVKECGGNDNFINTWNSFLGGDFNISDRDIVFEFNKKRKKIKLPIHLSASSLKSLLIFDIFIKHNANGNFMLFLDEPEINLSPFNQILLARFIVYIMKTGIPVFLTTHSDYILREINNMILMNNLDEKQLQLIKNSDQRNSFYPTLDPKNVNIQQLTRKKNKVIVREIKATKDGIEKNIFDDAIQYQNNVTKDIFFI